MSPQKQIPFTVTPEMLKQLDKLMKATGQTARAAAIKLAIAEACEKRGIK